jgi:hypothetical protein
MGERFFLVARRVTGRTTDSVWVWLPVSEIESIEEFATVEDMLKTYPGIVPVEKKP